MSTRGEKIRAERKRRGLSQSEIAKAANISQQSYCNIEADITANPSRRILKAISEMLDIPFESLLLGDDWREPIPEESRVVAREYAVLPPDVKNEILTIILKEKARKTARDESSRTAA